MLLFVLCFIFCLAATWFVGALLYSGGNLWLAIVLAVSLVLTLLICILVKLTAAVKKLAQLLKEQREEPKEQ